MSQQPQNPYLPVINIKDSIFICSKHAFYTVLQPLRAQMTDATLLISLQLSDHLFEELAMDVYDEVDRRETDAGEMISS